MKKVLCKKLPTPEQPVLLEQGEARHLVTVLRMKSGEVAEAMDGQGSSCHCEIQINDPDVVLVYQGSPAISDASSTLIPAVLEMAVLKGDAMVWTIEKAVELGFQSMVPVIASHSVVQLDRKGVGHYQERWQKIADQSLKQCGRLQRLLIQTPISLGELPNGSSIRVCANEALRTSLPPLWKKLEEMKSASVSEIRYLVGPEGGWSPSERAWISKNSEEVSLGPLVLRAETAAIYGMSLIQAFFRSKS